MSEHTIELSDSEYDALLAVEGKTFKKRRFAYYFGRYEAEIDVYLDALIGLVVVDFEFTSDEDMKEFEKPNFVGADVTQDALVAGGMLCGKSFADIAQPLREKYKYEPIVIGEEFYEV